MTIMAQLSRHQENMNAYARAGQRLADIAKRLTTLEETNYLLKANPIPNWWRWTFYLAHAIECGPTCQLNGDDETWV